MGTLQTCDVNAFPYKLEFNVLSSDEIKKISVVNVITSGLFDELGHPLPGGLYDRALGPQGTKSDMQCSTCYSMQSCAGHMGHIELTSLVFNPILHKLLYKILHISCTLCFKLQIKDHLREIVILQLRLIDAGYIIEAQELEVFKSETAAFGEEVMIKVESKKNAPTHPRIAELYALVENNSTREHEFTSMSNCIRSAIVNVALQGHTTNKCIHCGKNFRKINNIRGRLFHYITAAENKSITNTTDATGRTKILLPDEARDYIRKIYANDFEFLEIAFLLFKYIRQEHDKAICPVDLLFMDTILVTPPNTRPFGFVGGKAVDNPRTVNYRRIIQNNISLRAVAASIKNTDMPISDELKAILASTTGSTLHEKFCTISIELQTSVNLLLSNVVNSHTLNTCLGLKQILERKEGLIRGEMMGKRVNYSARTVITPDPNIGVDEVGIPDVFAKKLSYPATVTPLNVRQLRQMVMNGPNIHPGANYIEDSKGVKTFIPPENAAKRESLAKLLYATPDNGLKIVHRHLLNGDVVLFNRQPTLHKPSLMSHKVRILEGEKTFRLHYSNCKAYNADFDGDEMNMHVPQSEVARSEAHALVNVENNYLVPKDGTPLGGLIQDHVIAGVLLSVRGRFFNREDYHQFVFQGLPHITTEIKLLPPAIMKPVRLWSGKQILSTIIINLIPEGKACINLHSRSRIAHKFWSIGKCRKPMCGDQLSDNEMSEGEVIIRKGELMCGILDKQQYGASTYGLIHCIYELYGGTVSSNLLTSLSKVFTNFLQRQGFSMGVKDILLMHDADKERRNIIKECRQIGDIVVANALGLDDVPSLDVLSTKMQEAYEKNPNFRAVLDRKYKSFLDNYTNQINSACLPNGLVAQGFLNNLQIMILSGAKGSLVNAMQISCLLGQIELEGKRPPLMISGKSLPSFTWFDTSPKSGGFIDGRFLTGIQPQEFFFHCMAGREGLIDTAVKTSRSGYLQRCLIKHLEGVTVHYDLTVRDSDKGIVQYLYGEDGLDVTKAMFLNKEGIEFLNENADVVLRADELKQVKDPELLSKIERHAKKIRSKQKKNKATKRPLSSFVHFSAELRSEIELKNPNKIRSKSGRRRLDEALTRLWKKVEPENRAQYANKYKRCPDPTISIYQQGNCYGSISEKLERTVHECTSAAPNRKAIINDISYMKTMKALAEPGESVGLLAAQSVGEPSTQMTLNTFHFAGRGEMNVTLGIPRLREILMLATVNIKTPSIDVPLLPHQNKHAEKMRMKFNRTTLADVLQFINVEIELTFKPDRCYQHRLHFQFLPRDQYDDNFCVRPRNILKYVNEVFFRRLVMAIIKSSSKKSDSLILSARDNERNAAKGNDKDDDDIDESPDKETTPTAKATTRGGDDQSSDDDFDEDGIKLKSKKGDDNEYDDPDADEEIADANGFEDDDDIDSEVEALPPAADEAEDESGYVAKKNGGGSGGDGDGQGSNAIGVDKILNHDMVVDYKYDQEHYLWCEITFNLSVNHKCSDLMNNIRNMAQQAVIHEVPGIKRAIVYNTDESTKFLKTDGINIIEIFKYDKILDLNRLYCNDIHAVAQTYGIEAATQVIIREVSNVFKVYGIEVNRRHLSLIADYMTSDGTFRPLSRTGFEHSASPLQQMSFESCLPFLQASAYYGRTDQLNSPSSRLMTGLPVRNGTGAFELLTSLPLQAASTI